MVKTNLLALAILFAGATCNPTFAQGQKNASSRNEGAITFEMLVNQYHFPVKKNTGNAEKDQQEYAAAKSKWVEANRELYRRYNQQGVKASAGTRRQTQSSLSLSK